MRPPTYCNRDKSWYLVRLLAARSPLSSAPAGPSFGLRFACFGARLLCDAQGCCRGLTRGCGRHSRTLLLFSRVRTLLCRRGWLGFPLATLSPASDKSQMSEAVDYTEHSKPQPTYLFPYVSMVTPLTLGNNVWDIRHCIDIPRVSTGFGQRWKVSVHSAIGKYA
jgi:hypothetical protein